MTPLRLAALALSVSAAACRPQERRALVLDFALSDPLVLESTTRPWKDAGYVVDYRRFYPHLTRSDLARYHTLLLLGGSEPERPSDRPRLADLALLTEWVGRGGVIVFGYAAEGEGSFDRWVMNRWLASLGLRLRIEEKVLQDSTVPGGQVAAPPSLRPRRTAPLQDAGVAAFPSGQSHAVHVPSARAVIAWASTSPERPTPVIAAGRVGNGLVVVASRHALAASGLDVRPATGPLPRPEDRRAAQVFLRALARWTRRPAEWASVPPARQPRQRLELEGGPLPVESSPSRLTPPEGVEVVALPPTIPAGGTTADTAAVRVPAWIRRGGMRVFWTQLQSVAELRAPSARGRELDSIIGFLEAAALGALATEAPRTDTSGMAAWEREYAAAAGKQILDRLETSSIRWIPVIRYQAPRASGDPVEPARGVRGDSLAAWCALDPRLWSGTLGAAYRAVARIGAERPELIPAVALDLPPPVRGYTMGHDFCDATYRAGLEEMKLDSARLLRLAALAVHERYGALLDGGLLGSYYAALERLVAARAEVLRREARAFARDMVFVFRLRTPPTDWFTLGLLRGFSAPGAPIVLWSAGIGGRDVAAALERRGIPVLHAVGVVPAATPRGAWARLEQAIAEGSDGFWVDAESSGPVVRSDSLARALRRLSRSLP